MIILDQGAVVAQMGGATHRRYRGARVKMSAKTNGSKDESFGLSIPEALLKRVEAYCQTAGIAPVEFIIDAISEKLASIHKEKRKKPRL